jgi:hypothetical protein
LLRRFASRNDDTIKSDSISTHQARAANSE